MRERLIELIANADSNLQEPLADYLLANGVIVLPYTPMGVMSDGNEFNSDVYCPHCGTNLSGYYGEESTRIIQCYECGQFLDNNKLISKEEAENALSKLQASYKQIRKEDEGK